MGNEIATMGNKQIAVMRNMLQGVEREIARALPKHMTPERMIRIALTAMNKNQALLRCTQESLIKAVIEASELGLEPSGILGHAYLIPYKDQCQLQVGYRGFIELAGRSGQVESIFAEVVYDCDTFTYEQGLVPVLRHVPNMNRDETATLYCAYAVAKLRGGTTVYRVMPKVDIEKRRAASKGKDKPDSPWKQWPEEMWRKTVIRALAKVLPLSPELSGAAVRDEQIEESTIEATATMITARAARVTAEEEISAKPEQAPEAVTEAPAADSATEPPAANNEPAPRDRVNACIAHMMKYGYNEAILGSLLADDGEAPVPPGVWTVGDLEYLNAFARLVEATPAKDRKALPAKVIKGEVVVGREPGAEG